VTVRIYINGVSQTPK